MVGMLKKSKILKTLKTSQDFEHSKSQDLSNENGGVRLHGANPNPA